MKKILSLLLLSLFITHPAHALTGFMVGKDETPIASASTKIIIATHDNHHTLTIMPSISAAASEIAFLIPVPASIKREDIHEASASLFDALDMLSAPRLIEDIDANPCTQVKKPDTKSYIVTAKHIADDSNYNISILPAADGSNLIGWLAKNNYKLPPKSERLITPYTQRGYAFVLAKTQRAKIADGFLQPLQISYDAPQLVLPVRLGLINVPAVITPPPKGKEAKVLNAAPDVNSPKTPAPIDLFNDGGQALTLYIVSPKGKAASPVLRSIPLNNTRMDTELPSLVTHDFPQLYTRMLDMRVKAEQNALLVEYAGAPELANDLLNSIGANWEKVAAVPEAVKNDISDNNNLIGGYMLPKAAMPKHLPHENAPAGKPFLTRLYTRYTATSLPQDIGITIGTNREMVSLRFFTHLPWQDDKDAKNACDISLYEQSLATRTAHAEQNLSRLTGWSIDTIREKMGLNNP